MLGVGSFSTPAFSHITARMRSFTLVGSWAVARGLPQFLEPAGFRFDILLDAQLRA